METQKNEKNEQKFNCVYCDFSCSAKSDWNRHILRPKHHKLANGNLLETKKTRKTSENYICVCGKKYSSKSGLWKHKSKNICKKRESITDHSRQEITTDKELILNLVKQNAELLEVIKNGTHHTTNNTYNKTFNLQFFLNETCKNAMNIKEFVENVEIQMDDLLRVGEKGYVEGITNIITSNLKALDITRRPIHCTDRKREILYIKDEDEWMKDEKKLKIKQVIKKISNKNINYLSSITTNNTSEGPVVEYENIMLESLGGEGNNENEKQQIIIKNISKNVFIEKE